MGHDRDCAAWIARYREGGAEARGGRPGRRGGRAARRAATDAP